MSDWAGIGTPISPGVAVVGCVEYLTIDEVQAEFGDDVAEMTDAQIQRRIDRLAAFLEEQFGHGFGRALIASSTGSHSVAVTATKLTIGGTDYTFAAYPTLQALVAAVNGAGAAYSLELLPHVNPLTPSDLLSALTAVACGPDYEDRVALCLSALWLKLSGKNESHLFLPLLLASVGEVVENLVVLASADYWAVAGESWLIRKYCSCDTTSSCRHPRGRWSSRYPGNITVEYTPQWWGRPPASLKALLIEAFGSLSGVGSGGMESESFGEYSYRRAKPRVDTWQEILGGSAVRRYAVQFHP